MLATAFPAHADELQADVLQAGLSRICGGIHYRFDVDAAQTLGRSTALWAMAYDRQHGLLSAVTPARQYAEHDRL